MKRAWWMVPAIVWSMAPAAARAQAAAAPCPADSARRDSAAVLQRASFQAAEVTFRTQPRASVRVDGCTGLPAVRVVERRNLPERVEPGVTYRDVSIAVEIVGRAEASCLAALAGDAALAAALGGGCTSAEGARPPAPP